MNYSNTNGQVTKAPALRLGAVICLILCGVSAVRAQTTAFTYQGKLTDGGNPANANYDLQFKLFDALTGGVQQGAVLDRFSVTVIAGVFTVTLDFSPVNVFSGANRYLEIGVRPANSAIAYTVLAPRQPITSSPYAIQTLNTQQLGGLPASRYVASDASGNVGIGTAASPLSKLTVQASGYGITQTDGTVTVGSYISNAAGGSGWFGTKSNHPLNFFTNDGLPQMTLATNGNVGIGISPTNKFHVLSSTPGLSAIYGESATGRGVWGKSTSSRGVYGESTSLEGVYGISSSGTGVSGASTSGSGVFGQTAVSSPTAGGVYGLGIGNDSLGVIGESNSGNNAVGVYGVTSSPNGFGIFARNLSGGRALYADGNAAQARDKGGWVKAMALINRDGVVVRCYNSTLSGSAASTAPCGITVPFVGTGSYQVTFNFQVDDRFISVTASQDTDLMVANIGVLSGNSVTIHTALNSDTNNVVQNGSPAQFTIFVY